MRSQPSAQLSEVLKTTLISELLPSSAESLSKLLEHFHLALFFLWRRYYEFAKRLCQIKYKLFDANVRPQGVDYLKPGRLIMAQLCLSASILLFRVTKSLIQAYRLHKRRLSQKRSESPQNPQESQLVHET